MDLTRRDVLCAVAALGTQAVLPTGTDAAQEVLPRNARRRPGLPPAFPATRDAFARHQQQMFRVLRTGQRSYGIGLLAVLDGAAAQAAGTVGSQHCFTAVFVGPQADPLPEETYEVETPAGASVLLFLKRSLVQDGYQYYEAPFNGLPPA